ncbi:uncharacterized protein LOC126898254 [Daktulosphaira vitifoliae]|uniref:uncharacterized protein LOC126898254 n=1 Tax=Daktulosphaira vitifoliae TaxID=58002 RepID=UPI0021A9FD7D|nr:uncharacterized protein LOC126898254 [Daktulosphaira vitifoliae]
MNNSTEDCVAAASTAESQDIFVQEDEEVLDIFTQKTNGESTCEIDSAKRELFVDPCWSEEVRTYKNLFLHSLWKNVKDLLPKQENMDVTDLIMALSACLHVSGSAEMLPVHILLLYLANNYHYGAMTPMGLTKLLQKLPPPQLWKETEVQVSSINSDSTISLLEAVWAE